MSEIAFVNDDPASREMIHGVIASEDYTERHAPDGWRGVTVLAEERTHPATAEPFTAAELRAAVNEVLAGCPAVGIEIV
jgi:CheY-like chemotaxis protein